MDIHLYYIMRGDDSASLHPSIEDIMLSPLYTYPDTNFYRGFVDRLLFVTKAMP
jgi:hypothetical protein